MILPSVNFYVTRASNARCSFRFAAFRDVPDQLPLDDARLPVRAIADAGVEKPKFVVGEPTLHRGSGANRRDSCELGLVTSMDPRGRFFGNATGAAVYCRPLLEVGAEEALAEVGVSAAKFVQRGGLYVWNR